MTLPVPDSLPVAWSWLTDNSAPIGALAALVAAFAWLPRAFRSLGRLLDPLRSRWSAWWRVGGVYTPKGFQMDPERFPNRWQKFRGWFRLKL